MKKIVKIGKISGSYGVDQVKISQETRGRWAGRFFTRGAGFAGRVAYSTLDRAMASVEAHAQFAGWEA